MGLAWGVAHNFARKILVQDRQKFSTGSFSVFFIALFLSAWVGAKALFVLLSGKMELIQDNNFWAGGGFVFYGGLMGGLLFVIAYNHFTKRMDISDLAALTVPIAFAHGIGRIGCFLAGCCYGTVTKIDWSIHLHNEDRHPTQLYEAFGLFVIAIILRKLLLQKNSPSKIILTYFIFYASLRFVLEFFRGDIIRGKYGLFSTSQIVSFSILIIIIFISVIRWRGRKTDEHPI